MKNELIDEVRSILEKHTKLVYSQRHNILEVWNHRYGNTVAEVSIIEENSISVFCPDGIPPLKVEFELNDPKCFENCI